MTWEVPEQVKGLWSVAEVSKAVALDREILTD